ncbi:MAG: EpsI family protein [Planctomycetaceae bacterium]|nr:EpsI family protein [Planctomycetaceae bacterium]
MGPLFFGMVIVIVSTLLTTYVVGTNWGWWGKMRLAMREAAVVIDKIPRNFDEWEAATDDEELDAASIEQLELEKYVVRRYTSKTTNETVSLIFMVGPTGRLTTHTPQICFGGRNYRMDSPPIPVSFPYEGDDGSTNKDSLAKIVFKNQSVSGGAKLFYYGVSAGQEWMPITGTSRSELRHYRFLYKLQVEAFTGEDQSGDDDVIARFLRAFLPTIRPELVKCI